MKTWIPSGLCAALWLASGMAAASPTANEFQSCHQQAAAVLMHCLDEKPGYRNDKCWDESARMNRSCYEEVKARHVRDPERIRAEQKAREAALKKM